MTTDSTNVAFQTEAQLAEVRKEGKGFDTNPPTNEEQASGILDWSQSGNMIDKAVRELNESLPAGQRQRTISAVRLLETGVTELRKYLAARGVDITCGN